MRLATGGKGKSFNDRELAGKVRTLALGHIKTILSKIDLTAPNGISDPQWQLLLRLAPNLLPRLQEHSGPDGEDLPVPILNVLPVNNSD